MNTILGIKFREYGQIYYFLAGQCKPSIGERVIVETEQGQGIGEVVLIRDTLPSSIVPQSDQEEPHLLIQNAVTSVVVVSDANMSVADIPYASAVTKKLQGLQEDSEEASTEENHEPNSYVLDSHILDAGHATSCETDSHACPCKSHDDEQIFDDNEQSACCGEQSSCHGEQRSCCGQQKAEHQDENLESNENLDGYVVASSDMLADDAYASTGMTMATDMGTPNGTVTDHNNIHGGRMVSYDGSAGEHSSDNQAPEDTSQPLSFDDLRPILRIATEYDLEHAMSNELLSREASNYCKECIKVRDLDMKLVDVEVFFDLSKFIFYFTAPSRIDFRELVKDLVKHYRTRIELRQIGVRHETQMIGAVGNCGMVCCCRRFLRKFAPVTIKMAKEQNLFLNPAKISGICGRLLCCLSYEQENYEEFHRRCPRLGKKYMTSKGPIKVMRANMFRNSLIAYSETGEELEIPLEEWQEMEVRRSDATQQSARPARKEARDNKDSHDKGAPSGKDALSQAEKDAESEKSVAPEKNTPADKAKTSDKAALAAKNISNDARAQNGQTQNGQTQNRLTQGEKGASQSTACKGACELCGDCGPSGKRGKNGLAQNHSTGPMQATNQDQHAPQSKNHQANPESSSTTPIKTAPKMAEKVVASLSGTPHVHHGLSEHGIATTKARQEALVQSLAGMDGGPLSAITHPDKPVTPAVVAAHVIADVISVAEAAAKQAPASIVMSERLIKSTDTSALKTSRGRRKRRRKPREGSAEAYSQDDADSTSTRNASIFFDNDLD